MKQDEGESKASPWSRQFLWIMGSLFLIGPVAGAFIFTTAGIIVGSADEPLQLAVKGAKVIGLAIGFCAPFIALFAVIRNVKDQSAQPAPRDDYQDSESRSQTD
jgi:hypothetical protein